MKWNYLFIVLAIGVLSSCYEEDTLTPTEGTEEIFKLPQGDHDYDTRIVKWFEHYGFYGLYIFDELRCVLSGPCIIITWWICSKNYS
ncbi:MAG: hypothetical protein BHV81_15255 [Butyricimonas synergistica]|nr:MAG: hypothetical protein BHV81_15255 [Butyricimonas synergistica]